VNSRIFWIVQNAFLIGVYIAASWFCISGHSDSLVVWLATIILFAHVLEIPLAFRLLKDLRPAPLRTAIGTFLFGFTYWLPVKRGIYPARGAAA
jgi:hypothetical protein